jgi:hypothetical protein
MYLKKKKKKPEKLDFLRAEQWAEPRDLLKANIKKPFKIYPKW